MNPAASLRIDIDSIPKELLQRLQNYGVTVPDKKASNEDVEVQKCFENKSSETLNKLQQNGVLSPKSNSSDDEVFRFSPKPRIEYVTLPEDVKSRDRNLDTVPQSPRTSREHCAVFGDNSDWIMLERRKSKSPPSSPDTTSRRNIFSFQQSSNSYSSNGIERQPKRSFSQSSIYDIEHTPTKGSQDSSFHHRLSPSIERTPIKDHLNFQEMGYQRHSPSIERTPIKQMTLSQNGKSIYTRSGSEESIINDRVPSPFIRESIDSNKLSPEQQSILLEELSRRGVKKQLSFDSHHYGDEDYYVRDAYVSPCKRRNHGNCDSDILISQLLTKLSQIKRRTSDDYCCDCDNERPVKRKRTECSRQVAYFRQQDSDTESFCKLKQQEPEVRPETCTCAVMEKQFLQMAENAYKNIRRKDSTADGFEQFRKELVATNEVLKETLNLLKNTKEMCEQHRFVT